LRDRRTWHSPIREGWTTRWELSALVLLITGIALLLRLVNLTSIPTGLHGDEAIVGMEGQRILREILIDPYSPSARGQPTAPFYLPAITVWLWDNTVFAVRISAVIFGTLAIPALYWVVRRSLGVPVALLSATFLAVLGWHIHYSRIAFPLPAWPLWVILTAAMIVHAVSARSYRWWAAAGVMSGAGIYVYNAHPLTLLICCTFVALMLGMRWKADSPSTIRHASAFAVGLLGSILPMIWFIMNNREMYFNSVTRHSGRQTAEWQALDGPIARAGYVVEQYARFWWELSFSPQVDYVDATGITAVVPVLILLLGLAGMGIALVRYREPLVWLGAMIVMVMPFATVLTEQGEMRRTLVIAPFLVMFSAIGVTEVIRAARARFTGLLSWSVFVVLALIISTGVATDLRNYFVAHAESPTQHWIFAEDFYQASTFMQTLTTEHYVYFMSERWSIDYEPRRFLAPEIRGEDRSDEFGRFHLDVDWALGQPVFVLVGEYRPALDALMQEYPEGEVVTGPQTSDPAFIAYLPSTEVE
jgi:4-amino-4-deoxy-L-arabinose transferase-like glycosyltransferase